MMDQVWVIGGAGRTGKAIVTWLHVAGGSAGAGRAEPGAPGRSQAGPDWGAAGVGRVAGCSAGHALKPVCCFVFDFVTYQVSSTALPVRVVKRDRDALQGTLDLRRQVVCEQKTVVSL